MSDRLPPGSPCTNCGKCCTNPGFMNSLVATPEDMARWRRERRHDILQWADDLGYGGAADLWIDPRNADRTIKRCPFVRRRGQRFMCTIYETRPQACRDYEPWSGLPNDVCEVVK